MFLQRHGDFLSIRAIVVPTHSFNTNSAEQIIEKQTNGILQSNQRHCESRESSGLGVEGDISAQKGFYRVNKRCLLPIAESSTNTHTSLTFMQISATSQAR